MKRTSTRRPADQPEHQPVWVAPSDLAAYYDVKLQTVLAWVQRGLTTRHDDGRVDYAQLSTALAKRGPRGFRRGERRPGHPTEDDGAPRHQPASA